MGPDRDLATLNGERALGVERWLRDLGLTDPDVVGRLSADLSDLYAGALKYRRQLDAVLEMPRDDPERLAQCLTDLAVELRHLGRHIRSSAETIEDLAERVGG